MNGFDPSRLVLAERSNIYVGSQYSAIQCGRGEIRLTLDLISERPGRRRFKELRAPWNLGLTLLEFGRWSGIVDLQNKTLGFGTAARDAGKLWMKLAQGRVVTPSTAVRVQALAFFTSDSRPSYQRCAVHGLAHDHPGKSPAGGCTPATRGPDTSGTIRGSPLSFLFDFFIGRAVNAAAAQTGSAAAPHDGQMDRKIENTGREFRLVVEQLNNSFSFSTSSLVTVLYFRGPSPLPPPPSSSSSSSSSLPTSHLLVLFPVGGVRIVPAARSQESSGAVNPQHKLESPTARCCLHGRGGMFLLAEKQCRRRIAGSARPEERRRRGWLESGGVLWVNFAPLLLVVMPKRCIAQRDGQFFLGDGVLAGGPPSAAATAAGTPTVATPPPPPPSAAVARSAAVEPGNHTILPTITFPNKPSKSYQCTRGPRQTQVTSCDLCAGQFLCPGAPWGSRRAKASHCCTYRLKRLIHARILEKQWLDMTASLPMWKDSREIIAVMPGPGPNKGPAVEQEVTSGMALRRQQSSSRPRRQVSLEGGRDVEETDGGMEESTRRESA
ncbi:unnamed protein product [Pleuronectes platessa]|uniref:Uncharacterized protein n=1 Tax=Pleuronectes platessa TaxID=8262 RepID=A0A9N7W3T1_PLEPL|nr:unnamed protein product [Pleuronectes platessa]